MNHMQGQPLIATVMQLAIGTMYVFVQTQLHASACYVQCACV